MEYRVKSIICRKVNPETNEGYDGEVAYNGTFQILKKKWKMWYHCVHTILASLIIVKKTFFLLKKLEMELNYVHYTSL